MKKKIQNEFQFFIIPNFQDYINIIKLLDTIFFQKKQNKK